MPPANDNIANAISISGASGSTTGDNTGATLETDEATCLCYTLVTRFYRDFSPFTSADFGYGGGRTVWWKWTCPADGFYKFETSSSGGSPIGDSIMAVLFGSDFATARLAGPDDDSGAGNYSAITFYAIAGLEYFIAVDGYNGNATDDVGAPYAITDTAEGTFTLTWATGVVADVKAQMVRAKDDYNAGSGTTSLVTNTRQEVRDVQAITSISGKQYGTLEAATDTCYVKTNRLPLPGYYQVDLAHYEAVGSGASNDFIVGMILNGLTIQPSQLIFISSTSNNGNQELTNSTGAGIDQGTWVLPIGDIAEIAVRLITGIGGAHNLDIYALRFTPVDKIAAMSTPSKLYTINDLMLGATSVPIDLDNDGDVTYKDLCVLGSDVYVLAERFYSGGVDLILYKYSGGSWSTISTDVWSKSHPTLEDEPAVAVDTDGTYVYCVYGVKDGTTTSGHDNWKWHCQKYDPGGNTFTELGTGQRHFGTTTFANQVGKWFYGIQVKIGPDGKIWVAWSEADNAGGGIYSAPNKTRAFISYWNGSSWNEVAPPDPPNVHGLNFIVNYNHPDDQRQIDLCFLHHDGPNDWPSIIYGAHYGADGGTSSDGVYNDFIYSEYNGSSWSNTLQFIAKAVWNDLQGTSGNQDFGHYHQGFAFIDDGSVPVWAVALLCSGGTDGAVAKMKSDGSAFEPYTDHAHPSYVSANFTNPTAIDAVYVGSTLMVLERSSGFGDTLVVVDEDIGTGQGYHVAAKENACIIYTENTVGYSRIYTKGSDAYVLAASRGFTADSPPDTYLGVWKVQGGAIMSYSLTPLR
jgi:hypothetical protein